MHFEIKNKVDGSAISFLELPRTTMAIPSTEEVLPLIERLSIPLVPSRYTAALGNLQIDLIPSSPEDRRMAPFVTGRGPRLISFFRNGDSWHTYNFDGLLVMTSPTRLEIAIHEININRIEEFFRSAGTSPPNSGFLMILIPLSGRPADYRHLIFNFSLHPVATPRLETHPADVASEYTTPASSFECLFVPELRGQLVYNFYEIEEDNFQQAVLKNYSTQKLDTIPKYISLSWTKAPLLVEVSMGSPPRAPAPTISGEGSALRLGGIVLSFEGAFEVESLLRSRTARTGRGGVPGGTETVGSIEEEFRRSGGHSIGPGDIEPEDLTRESDVSPILDADMTTVSNDSTQYVGYVIIKERYDEFDDDFKIVDMIVIPNRDVTNYIDWRIAYRDVYRYKVRSLFKFVNQDRVPILADSDASLGVGDTSNIFGTGRGLASNAYFFDSEMSNPVELEVIDNVRPDAPHSLQAFPNSMKKEIMVIWGQKNKNKDVVGFNVYRRTGKEPFVALNSKLLDIRNNIFVDKSIEENEEYIYAIESIDFHDNRSLLSAHIKAKISQYDYEIGRCEEAPQIVAPAGQELDFQAISSTSRDVIQINKQCEIIINPVFYNLEENTIYMIRATSLDSFDEKEIKLKFVTKIINHRRPVTVPDSVAGTVSGMVRTSRDEDEDLGLGDGGRFGI